MNEYIHNGKNCFKGIDNISSFYLSLLNAIIESSPEICEKELFAIFHWENFQRNFSDINQYEKEIKNCFRYIYYIFSNSFCKLSHESKKLLTKITENINSIIRINGEERNLTGNDESDSIGLLEIDLYKDNNANYSSFINENQFNDNLNNSLCENLEHTKGNLFLKKLIIVSLTLVTLVTGAIITINIFQYFDGNEKNLSPSSEKAELETIAIDLNKWDRMARDDEITELAQEAQQSIEIYNEYGEYDCEAMFDAILERIASNPIYGYMVAQGLQYARSKSSSDSNSTIQKIDEFLEKTATSYSNPEDIYTKGIRKWLIRTGDKLYSNDEYKEYADSICFYLIGFWNYGIHDFKATMYWTIDSTTSEPQENMVRYDETMIRPTLVLSYHKRVIGFWLENGSIAYCDPNDLGMDIYFRDEEP